MNHKIRYNTTPQQNDTADTVRSLLDNHQLTSHEYILDQMVTIKDWDLLIDVIVYQRTYGNNYGKMNGITHVDISNNVSAIISWLAITMVSFEKEHIQVDTIKSLIKSFDRHTIDQILELDWVPHKAKRALALLISSIGNSRYRTWYLGSNDYSSIDNRFITLLKIDYNSVITIDDRYTHEHWLHMLRNAGYEVICDDSEFTEFLLEDKTRCDGWKSPSIKSLVPDFTHNHTVGHNSVMGTPNELFQMLEDHVNDIPQQLSSGQLVGDHLFIIDEHHKLTNPGHNIFNDVRNFPVDGFVGSDLHELVFGTDTVRRGELAKMLELWNNQEWGPWMYSLFEELCKLNLTMSFNLSSMEIDELSWGPYTWVEFDARNLMKFPELNQILGLDDAPAEIHEYIVYKQLTGKNQLINGSYPWLTIDLHNRVLSTVDLSEKPVAGSLLKFIL